MNIAPKGKKQGEYFNHVIGPYDFWAIEYGYKPLPGGTEGEVGRVGQDRLALRRAGAAIRHRRGRRRLRPDPLTNRFDLSSDPVEFARRRVEVINQFLPGIVEQVVEPGEGYQHVRRAFHILMSEHDRAMGFVARYIGGVYVNRDHKGDPNGRPPFVVTEAKKQREALDVPRTAGLRPGGLPVSHEALQLPRPDPLDALGHAHEGAAGLPDPRNGAAMAGPRARPAPFADHAFAADGFGDEGPAEQDVFTAAELLQGLTASIFRETEKLQEGKFTNREPAISSLRRNLQQNYFQRLADMAMGNIKSPITAAELVTENAPVDCRP